MAIDRVPALKRCRALGIEPAVVGLAKQSKRQLRNANHKVSENSSACTTKKPNRCPASPVKTSCCFWKEDWTM